MYGHTTIAKTNRFFHPSNAEHRTAQYTAISLQLFWLDHLKPDVFSLFLVLITVHGTGMILYILMPWSQNTAWLFALHVLCHMFHTVSNVCFCDDVLHVHACHFMCIFSALRGWNKRYYWYHYDPYTQRCVNYSGPWFNIKMTSYQYRKSHCGDKTVARSSYLHNGISYAAKMSSLYWIGAQVKIFIRFRSYFVKLYHVKNIRVGIIIVWIWNK